MEKFSDEERDETIIYGLKRFDTIEKEMPGDGPAEMT